MDDIELIDALAELRQRHGGGGGYQRLWALCVNGHVPARRVGRRWRVSRADLPRIAAALSGPAPSVSAEPAPAAA